MRIIGFILVASLALAVLKAALAVALVIYLGLLVVAAITRPAELSAFLGFYALCYLLQAHTLAALGMFAATCLIAALSKARNR